MHHTLTEPMTGHTFRWQLVHSQVVDDAVTYRYSFVVFVADLQLGCRIKQPPYPRQGVWYGTIDLLIDEPTPVIHDTCSASLQENEQVA